MPRLVSGMLVCASCNGCCCRKTVRSEEDDEFSCAAESVFRFFRGSPSRRTTVTGSSIRSPRTPAVLWNHSRLAIEKKVFLNIFCTRRGLLLVLVLSSTLSSSYDVEGPLGVFLKIVLQVRGDGTLGQSRSLVSLSLFLRNTEGQRWESGLSFFQRQGMFSTGILAMDIRRISRPGEDIGVLEICPTGIMRVRWNTSFRLLSLHSYCPSFISNIYMFTR